jgi:V-type H+-transporting ATPase subunit a
MSLGIFMKAFNALYFRRYVDFLFEFLPQIILLWALFGWMDLLVIVKWLTPWEVPCTQSGARLDSSSAPSIITIMIAMFLKGGAITPGETWLIGTETTGYPQEIASIVLVLIFLCMIPLMLLVKPLYLKFTMKPHDDHHDEHHDGFQAVNTSEGDEKVAKKAENIDLDKIL